MIEINLLPGAEKRKKRRTGGFSFKLPESMPAFDRMLAFVVAACVLSPAAVAWMYFSVQAEKTELRAALDVAAADSVRFAQVIRTQQALQARQDTIVQKLAIIQEIDAGRYIWPHILDEVSLALPPFTWLQQIDQISGGPSPRFQLRGRTGSLPALSRFMDALEASPFIRNVQLVSSEQAQLANDPTRIVNNFVLTGSYEQPPMEAVQTVPLFEDAAAETAASGREASDGASAS